MRSALNNTARLHTLLRVLTGELESHQTGDQALERDELNDGQQDGQHDGHLQLHCQQQRQQHLLQAAAASFCNDQEKRKF